MTNVIGYYNDSDRRQNLWNALVSLREVLRDPLQEKQAELKEKKLYNFFLEKYISDNEGNLRFRG